MPAPEVRLVVERARRSPERVVTMPAGFGRVVRELPDHATRPCVFVAGDAVCSTVVAPPCARTTAVPHPACRLGAVDIGTATLLLAITPDHAVEAWDARTGVRLRPVGCAELPERARFAAEATGPADWGEWVTQDGMCIEPGSRGLALWHVPVVDGAHGDGQWVHGVVVDARDGTFSVVAAWRLFEPGGGLECLLLDPARGMLHGVRAADVPGSDDEVHELVSICVLTGATSAAAVPVPKDTAVAGLELGPAGRVVVQVTTA